MPGGDKKGPRGSGPMTGRGLGICSGSDRPGYEHNHPGRGRAGRGGGMGFERRPRGGGRGWRNRQFASEQRPAGTMRPARRVAPTDELSELKLQAQQMREVLEELVGRIGELERRSDSSRS